MAGLTQHSKTRQEGGSREIAPRGGAMTPFGDFPFLLSRMRDEFDRFFERMWQRWPSPWQGQGWRWGLDIREEDDDIVVRAEAPGFDAGDFDIQVMDNRLTLRARKKSETKGKEDKPTEYYEHECYESVTLPAGIDKDKVDARYQNGVLTVTLPKTVAAKGKRITVKNM